MLSFLGGKLRGAFGQPAQISLPVVITILGYQFFPVIDH